MVGRILYIVQPEFKYMKGTRSQCVECLSIGWMRNAGLEETQAKIKIAGRNINNLRYADDTNLMA